MRHLCWGLKRSFQPSARNECRHQVCSYRWLMVCISPEPGRTVIANGTTNDATCQQLPWVTVSHRFMLSTWGSVLGMGSPEPLSGQAVGTEGTALV